MLYNGMQVQIIFDKIPLVTALVEAQAATIVLRAGYMVRAEAAMSMTRGKSGRMYTYRGSPHQASAPGEAPAIMSGNLLNRQRVKMEQKTTVGVYFDARYARPLEFGTHRMAARPFARPAANKVRPWLVQQLRLMRVLP